MNKRPPQTRGVRGAPERVTHVGVYWGEDVLSYRRVEPGTTFSLEGRVLVEVRRDGTARLYLWGELDDHSPLVMGHGEEPITLAALRDAGECLELEEGFAAQLARGTLTVGITHERGSLAVMPRSWVTELRRAMASSLAVACAAAALLAFSRAEAPPPEVREAMREDERLELASLYLMRAAERDEERAELERVREEEQEEAEGGARTRRFGVSGPGEGTLAEPIEFGMIGVLRSTASAAPVSARRDAAPHPEGSAHAQPGPHPPVDPADDPLSTFAVDVDTGSYSLVRRALERGELPSLDMVRAEELVNYFDYGYEEPARDAPHPFVTHVDAAPSPFEAGHLVVRVAVQAKRLARADRRRAHLVYLVDTSGSMIAPDKLALAKESLRLLTHNLRPDDTVALCTYAGSVAMVLPPTPGSDKAKIVAAIDGLGAEGATAMESGIELAYSLAEKTLVPGDVNRVIILSDGDANVGATSQAELLTRIDRARKQGITLSTVGFGTGNYRDALMEQLADAGDGNYSYVDSIAQARRVFVERAEGLLEVVARDVKVQVEFEPRFVKSYRLIGYENRAVADVDFREDHVDGGEIGAGHSVTALYDVVPHPVTLASLAPKSWLSVRLRHKAPEGSELAAESEVQLEPARIPSSFEAATPAFRMAVAAAGLAEVLRQNPHAGWSVERLVEVGATLPPGPEAAELVASIEATRRLFAAGARP